MSPLKHDPSRDQPQGDSATMIPADHSCSRRRRLGLLAGMLALLAPALGIPVAAPAVAVTPAPAWAIRSDAMPTYVAPGGEGNIVLLLTNPGGRPTNGTIPVTVTDTLPAGLTVTGVTNQEKPSESTPLSCTNTSSVVTCTGLIEMPGVNTDGVVIRIGVAAAPGASSTLTNSVIVSGGGAPEVSTTSPVTISAQDAPFGVGNFHASTLDASGAFDTQAGDHANAATTGFVLNTRPPNAFGGSGQITSSEPVRDIVVDLPAGLVGNPQAVPTCPQYFVDGGGKQCPTASIVGSVAMNLEFPNWELSAPVNTLPSITPIFNVVPERGRPAQFAFDYLGKEATMYASVVHTDAGYVLRVTAPGIPRVATLNGLQLTFFGNPAAQDGGLTAPAPFLTNPFDCSQPNFTTTILADSWDNPGRLNADGSPDLSDPNWKTQTAISPPVAGCEKLQFSPTFSLQPDTTQADSPAGANIDLAVPQNNDPSGLATPELKDATVTLPQGMSVNPSSADGLQACSDAQVALSSTDPATCPNASVIGTVKIHTPLLAEPLEGRVFLGTPLCGPCTSADAQSGRMLRLFIEAANPNRGVDIKLAGTVSADPSTGQLAASFKNNPQLPFDDLQLQLKGGSRAPLANPQICGQALTTSDLTPWSAPGTPDATPAPSFNVDWDGVGGACPGSLPFSPGFSAGTTVPLAGGFSPFTLTLLRHDREQNLGGLGVQLPPGLLGALKSIPLCGEPQAAQGTCPQASQIGTARAAAGAGSHPFWVSGPVYLTGPYGGAPFGLSIAVPAVAGPFNLGTVIVRAAIHVDLHTAAVTIASDPLPQMLDGIPLRIQTVSVTVDRAGFMFNPTSCAQQQITGTIAGVLPGGGQGASVGVSTPFAVAGCAGLPFAPAFSVSTQARTSKASGASLDVRVGYPSGAQANIHRVAVSLPRQLPSRLTTIQQACPEVVFDANPALCPAGSNIGVGTATTPVLSNPVVGPAYLVSHGGAAFPDIVLILQGEGVTVDLVGSIDIRHGVTSSTFANVPDVPISSFDLTLPEGPHSALAGNLPARAGGSLCGQSLVMPTTITGQNGAVVRQSTRIRVTGCPRAKRKHKHRAKHKRGRK